MHKNIYLMWPHWGDGQKDSGVLSKSICIILKWGQRGPGGSASTQSFKVWFHPPLTHHAWASVLFWMVVWQVVGTLWNLFPVDKSAHSHLGPFPSLSVRFWGNSHLMVSTVSGNQTERHQCLLGCLRLYRPLPPHITLAYRMKARNISTEVTMIMT